MLSEQNDQSLEKVSALMFHAPVAIILLKGPSHTVEIANKLALLLWRKSGEEFLHRPLLESLPELAAQGIDKILSKVYHEGRGITFKEVPLRIKHNDQLDTIYTKLSFEPLRNSEGVIEGMYCIACDVTEDALSKARIQDRAVQFMNLANAMPQVVWIARASGDVIYYNDRISHYAGAKKMASGVWSWEGVVHPDDIEPTHRAWSQALETGTVYEAEHRLKMSTGEYRWHLSRALPQKDELGIVTQWYGTATDVHLQKEVESNLRISEAEFRASFENSSVGMAQVDHNTGRFLLANDAFCHMVGYTLDELQQLRFEQLTYGEDGERDLALFASMVNGETKEYHAVKQYIRKDGRIIWITITANLIYDGHGTVKRTNAIIRDITQRKAAEDALRDSEEKFRAFLHHTPVLAWSKDESGRFVYVNKSYEQRFGIHLKDFIGKTNHELFPYEVADKLWEHDLEVLNSGKSLESTEEMIEPDGKKSYWLNFKFCYKDVLERKYVGGVGYEVTMQKNVEETLQKLATHLQMATEAANVGTWVYDLGTQKLEWSRLHKRLWGYEENQDELNYEQWHGLIYEEDKKLVFGRVQDTIDLNEPYDIFYRIKRYGDGVTKWMRSVGKCLYDESGRPISMTGVTIDVTEEKVREREFLKVKEQLELTFRNVPTGILLFNKDKRLVFANDKGAKFSGFKSVEEMTGEIDLSDVREKGLKEFVVLDEAGLPMTPDKSGVVKAFMTKKTSQGIYSIHYLKDDSVIWIYYVCNPLLDEQGEVNMVIATITDITMQKEAENLVRQSEEKLRILAASIPELVIMMDPEGNVEYHSDRWNEYAGITLSHAAWTSLLHEEDRFVETEWPGWIKSGKPFKMELRLRNKENEFRWHTLRAEPVTDDDGDVMKWICVLTDINEQKNSAEMLENLVTQRTFELQRSNEGLQQFAHVASHDLKEPVRKIKIFGNRLREEFGEGMPDQAGVYLGKMETAANRMFAMIEGVLQYSSLNATQQANSKVDLNEVLKSIESDLEMVVMEKEAVITYDTLPVIEGVPVLLYQLFYNLLNNSLKFSKANESPVIRITSSETTIDGKKYAKLEVIDNGIGFEQEYAEKIFYTFARLNPKDMFEGTGLGLSLCRSIAERHHGFIKAKGEVDKGAVFTVMLPPSSTSDVGDKASS